MCVCVCVIECIVWIFMNFRHYSSICHFLYHFCLLLLAKRIIILFFSLMNFSCFFFLFFFFMKIKISVWAHDFCVLVVVVMFLYRMKNEWIFFFSSFSSLYKHKTKKIHVCVLYIHFNYRCKSWPKINVIDFFFKVLFFLFCCCYHFLI